MSPRPRRSAVPADAPATRQGSAVRLAARVVGLVLVLMGGVAAGVVVVQPSDAGAAREPVVAAGDVGGDGPAAGRSATRGEVPAGDGAADGAQAAHDVPAADDVPPAGDVSTPGAAPAAGDVAGARGAGAPDVTVPAADVVVAPDADLRPIPVPRLVPRDTRGPLWLTPADRAAGIGALEVPERATGVLDVVPGASPAPGGVGVRTVRVEVERGLPVDGPAFADFVMATLNDPRGWGARGDVTFARTDGAAELRVLLASPALVDALCAPLNTRGEVSCGRNGHAALNVRRWVEATDDFVDRTQYRQYLVNHEVGHLLGHPHQRCPAAGQPAPVMQQQSVRVAPCLPNGWPYP